MSVLSKMNQGCSESNAIRSIRLIRRNPIRGLMDWIGLKI